jgi:hypothetical protein
VIRTTVSKVLDSHTQVVVIYNNYYLSSHILPLAKFHFASRIAPVGPNETFIEYLW